MFEKKEIALLYGNEWVKVKIPQNSLIKYLHAPDISISKDLREVVRRAFNKPIESDCLLDIAKHRKSAVIMIPDQTRAIPLSLLLPLIVEQLVEAGMSRKNIRFLVGLGTHRPMTQEELKEHVGEEIFCQYEVLNHEWWNSNQLVNIGVTENGIPIEVNKVVVNAELRLAVGTVKPHRVAGWSGGAKMIQPGVSGLLTTGYTHWNAAQYRVGEILGEEENPIRKEMEDIAKMVELNFIVNCVLNGHNRLVGVFAGNYVAAHRACVSSACPYYTFAITELADILIVGTGSHARNIWAVGSGPNWAELVLKEGGTVILFAPCPDGVSNEHPDVIRYGYLPLKKVRELVEDGEIKDLSAAAHIVYGGEKIYNKGINCILVSDGVTREEANSLGLEYAETPQEAVNKAFALHGENARVYVFSGEPFAEFVINYNK